MVDCKRQVVLAFLIQFEGNFVCPTFCSFNADSTVICVPCVVERVCYESYS